MSIINALKSVTGEFEITRLLGAGGVVSYVVGAHSFVIWTMVKGGAFDLVGYCTAFPAGLGMAVGAVAGGAALKDRQVAQARAITAQGAPVALAPPVAAHVSAPAPLDSTRITPDVPEGG